jgi:hypothetical protein
MQVSEEDQSTDIGRRAGLRLSERLIVLVAILSGTLWIVWGLLVLGQGGEGYECTSPKDVLADVVFALAGVSLFATLTHVALQFRGVRRWTAGIAGVGAAVMGIGNGIEHCAVESFSLVYVIGAIGMFLAGLLFGISILVLDGLPRWLGPLLVVGTFAFQANGSGGPVLFGLVWIVLGIVL